MRHRNQLSNNAMMSEEKRAQIAALCKLNKQRRPGFTTLAQRIASEHQSWGVDRIIAHTKDQYSKGVR